MPLSAIHKAVGRMPAPGLNAQNIHATGQALQGDCSFASARHRDLPHQPTVDIKQPQREQTATAHLNDFIAMSHGQFFTATVCTFYTCGPAIVRNMLAAFKGNIIDGDSGV